MVVTCATSTVRGRFAATSLLLSVDRISSQALCLRAMHPRQKEIDTKAALTTWLWPALHLLYQVVMLAFDLCLASVLLFRRTGARPL
eukprot:943107-Amphidinium_carterae.1